MSVLYSYRLFLNFTLLIQQINTHKSVINTHTQSVNIFYFSVVLFTWNSSTNCSTWELNFLNHCNPPNFIINTRRQISSTWMELQQFEICDCLSLSMISSHQTGVHDFFDDWALGNETMQKISSRAVYYINQQVQIAVLLLLFTLIYTLSFSYLIIVSVTVTKWKQKKNWNNIRNAHSTPKHVCVCCNFVWIFFFKFTWINSVTRTNQSANKYYYTHKIFMAGPFSSSSFSTLSPKFKCSYMFSVFGLLLYRFIY